MGACHRILIFALLVCVQASCRNVYPRAVQRVAVEPETVQAPDPQLKKDSDWPERWGTDRIVPGMQVGVVVETGYPYAEVSAMHLSRFHQLRIGEAEYLDMQSLARWTRTNEPYKFQAEGPGSYLFVHNPPIDDHDPRKLRDGEPELFFKFISARRDGMNKAGEISQDRVELERTWFTYRIPRDDKGCIGTLVIMPGMFGTPEPVIEGVERYFRSRGWAVLRMLSHPSRFTERRQYAVPKGSEAKVARKIAEMFDTRTAEAGYAVSAGLGFVHERFAGHAQKPVVLMGMSGGAMILPSVYSFDPSLFDACVLIAGGGNFLEINIRSNYANWIDAIDLDADPSDHEIQKPEREQLNELTDLYMAMSKLDALHTAGSMDGVPVLMLHGSADKAVPASTGDALHRALGEPERWVYPVGHELIFAGLPFQTSKIEKWIREQVIEQD